MTVKVRVSIQRTRQVKTGADALYALLSRPAEAHRFFPRVQKIVALGNDRYHWTMEPMGTQKYQHQVVYAAQWECDPEQRTVRWRPLPDQGNAQIGGVWQVEPTENGTCLTLEIRAELHLDLPRWMQVVAQPIVQTEFQQLLDRYFDNVAAYNASEALAVN